MDVLDLGKLRLREVFKKLSRDTDCRRNLKDGAC